MYYMIMWTYFWYVHYSSRSYDQGQRNHFFVWFSVCLISVVLTWVGIHCLVVSDYCFCRCVVLPYSHWEKTSTIFWLHHYCHQQPSCHTVWRVWWRTSTPQQLSLYHWLQKNGTHQLGHAHRVSLVRVRRMFTPDIVLQVPGHSQLFSVGHQWSL